MTMGYPVRRGGGGGMRLILAVIILLGGAMSYYCSTQQNPITHESQRVKLTPDQEVQLGLESAPEMAAQMGGVLDPRVDARAREVVEVGHRLAGGLPNNPYQFDFHLLRDEQTVNAFALPGGQIFVTAALYNRMETEGELAGVVGHEIGHVAERHAAQQMATGDFYRSIVMATGVASQDQRAAAAAQFITQMRQLKYGRGDELESDQWGLKLMAQAGYDPREMLRVMEILKSVSSGSGSEMMSTHPLPESRIEKIQAWLQKEYVGGVPGNLSRGRALPH